MKVCTVPSCDREARGTLCYTHYGRLWRTGELRADEPIKTRARITAIVCITPGCTGVPKAKNYCWSHYRRWKRYGDPLAAPSNFKGGHLNEHGYRIIYDRGRQRAEHRVVMEKHLGRDLLPDENIHHINGVRDDNRIENLELWSTAQPPGQRVADKVAWAKMILARYEELA